MQGPKPPPIDVLPMVAGVIDAGLAHIEDQCATLKVAHLMSDEFVELIVVRTVRFSENMSKFHADYELVVAGYPLAPREQQELDRLRAVLVRARALAMEAKQILEEADAKEANHMVQRTNGTPLSRLLSRISINPAICGGRPYISERRIRVSLVLDLLASGYSFKEIENEHDLEESDIQACLAYGAAVARYASLPQLVDAMRRAGG